MQRISISIQKGNAAAILSFLPADEELNNVCYL